MSYPRTVGPFTVTTVANPPGWPIPRTHWRGGFYAHGKHFIVYGDGTGVVYRHSSDEGATWSAPVTVRATVTNSDPDYMSVHFDGVYLHYAMGGNDNQPMLYRRGLINSDGSITWSAAEQTAVSAVPAHRYLYLSITVDSEGCPAISYEDDGPSILPYITKSSTNDGTWSTEAGHPLQLHAQDTIEWKTEAISLGSKRLCVLYSSYMGVPSYRAYFRIFDGSSWGAEEGDFLVGDQRIHSIARGPDSSVLFSYMRNKDVQFRRRPWGGPWGGEVKVWDNTAGTSNVIARGPGGSIYVFQFTNYGSYVDYVVYAVSTDGGTTWTNKAGGAAPEVWIDETIDDATQHWTFSSSYQTWDGVLSFVYITKNSSPYNVRYAALRFWESEDLKAKFEVGQGSIDLKAGFLVAQDSTDLFAKFIIRQKATVDLSGEFTVRHEGIPVEVLGKALVRHLGSAELLGKFDVGQDSAELLGKFEAQVTAELLGKGIIRNVGSAELLGNAEIRQLGSVELLGKGIIRQSGSAELLGNAIIRHLDSADLLGKAEVQHSGSAELLGRAKVQQSGSAELLSRAEIQQSGSAELLGRAEVRQSGSTELLGKAIIRNVGFAELLSKGIIRNVGSAELLDRAVIRHVGTPTELLSKVDIRHVGTPVDLLGKAIIRNIESVELLGKCIIRNVGSAELLDRAVIRNVGSAELLGNAIIRNVGSAELLGKAKIQQRASADLPTIFWIRHLYRLWTNRRYLNGVVELDETELSDALLEYVIQGVMDDIKSQLINEDMLVYNSWTDITKTPKLIRRATTYGTVASLYSRDINDPNRRIVMGLRPIRIRAAEVRSAQERAMDYWESRMEKMMSLYLTSGGRKLMIVDTEDEEAIFSMEDIPFYSEDPYKIQAR